MANKSKFLPDSVSGALKGLVARVLGGCVFVFGIAATFALVFYNSYLDGFAVASTFGDQSWLGWLVGFIKYGVGTITGVFLLLCIARWGLARLIGLDCGGSPEYNLLRAFIAVCVGASGFGMVAPSAGLGGVFGAVAASDVGRILGAVTPVVGLVLIALFFVMAGMLLHVKWAHVRFAIRLFWRWIRWVGAAFHLSQPVEEDTDDAADGEEDTDDAAEEAEDEVEEEPVENKRRGLLRKRTPAKKAVGVAVPVRRSVAEFQLPEPRFLERSNFSKCAVTAD